MISGERKSFPLVPFRTIAEFSVERAGVLVERRMADAFIDRKLRSQGSPRRCTWRCLPGVPILRAVSHETGQLELRTSPRSHRAADRQGRARTLAAHHVEREHDLEVVGGGLFGEAAVTKSRVAGCCGEIPDASEAVLGLSRRKLDRLMLARQVDAGELARAWV